MRVCRFILAWTLLVAALAGLGGSPCFGQPFEPAAGAGLFAGVNQFDHLKPPLNCGVHDAIDQAYLFCVELKLIAPNKTILALSGTPRQFKSIDKLRELRQAGVRVVPATQESIEASAEWVAESASAQGILIFSFISHGQRINGRDYLAGTDSRPEDPESWMALDWLWDDDAPDPRFESQAPRQLAFIETYQAFNAPPRWISSGAAMKGWSADMARGSQSAPLYQALGQARGRAAFVAASAGAQPWEVGQEGNGLFARVLLETLRSGKGANPDDGLLLASRLEARLNEALWDKIDKMASQDPEWKQAQEVIDYPVVALRFSRGGEGLPVAADATMAVASPNPAPQSEQSPDDQTCLGCEAAARGDHVEAARLYRIAADRGDVRAAYNLGVMYENGKEGVPQDLAEAARLYRIAADKGNDCAMNNLATLYLSGKGGVKRNNIDAIRLFRASAEKGNATAMRNLGWLYFSGEGGVPRDEPEAVRFYRQAADKGEASSMTSLGVMYQTGRGGLPQDDAEAARLYQKAADLGEPMAMTNLGAMREQGQGGLPKSEAEALKLYVKAARLGEPNAQNRLRQKGEIW